MQIYIIDDLPPESQAMLQALYSRSPKSVVEHLKKVKEVGPEKFMGQYYVGYGHRSIGDCAETSIFIENVSMLAAKAIQDWPLYRGQEASTRYMDFSSVRIEDPLGTPESTAIQHAWFAFYHDAKAPMREHLLKVYPKKEGEKDGDYTRAIDARMFDILRAFLPAGTTTNLSWTSDLRQAADHLDWLMVHPDPMIRRIGEVTYQHCYNKYPSSFADRYDPKLIERNAEGVAWKTAVSEDYNYNDAPLQDGVSLLSSIRREELKAVQVALQTRPRFAELPAWMGKFGSLASSFALDFGSFRDLQRHRNGVVRMPLLTVKHGFHPWYWDQMPEALRAEAKALVEKQSEAIRALPCTPVVAQYYCAMGYRVVCEVTQGLPAFVYRIELRTGQSIHPTLRSVTQEEARLFASIFPEVRIHPDLTPDTWDTRRGKQTILEKT